MKLSVRVDERAAPLELTRAGDSCRFHFDGHAREAAIEEVEPGVYSVLIGSRSYEVKIESGINQIFVAVNGRRFAVEVRDPRRWDSRLKGALAEGRQNVSAPMPGKVVRVLIAEGDVVEAGQGIAVVEAMKMQNEMKAPKAGRVLSVSARQGDTVAAGQVLAVIE